MSSADKQGDVAVQRKEDGVTEKDKAQNDVKSDTSPQKRSASEVSVKMPVTAFLAAILRFCLISLITVKIVKLFT